MMVSNAGGAEREEGGGGRGMCLGRCAHGTEQRDPDGPAFLYDGVAKRRSDLGYGRPDFPLNRAERPETPQVVEFSSRSMWLRRRGAPERGESYSRRERMTLN